MNRWNRIDVAQEAHFIKHLLLPNISQFFLAQICMNEPFGLRYPKLRIKNTFAYKYNTCFVIMAVKLFSH